jgi:hypothetical protein
VGSTPLVPNVKRNGKVAMGLIFLTPSPATVLRYLGWMSVQVDKLETEISGD